jgi:ribose transport system permease protein
MALGMVLVLSEGDIDLSVGSVLSLTNVIGAQLLVNTSINPWLAGLIALLAGAACGFVNGALSIILRIPTFVVTLGTLSAYSGLALVIANGQSVSITATDNSFFNIAGGSVNIGTVEIPATVIVMLALCALATLVYNRTPFGRKVCAVGSNRQAARFAGIRIERLRLLVMTSVSALAGLSGVLTMAYLQSGGPNYGQGFELSVIASAIVGGTALTGGSGTMPGAILGSLIIAVISNGLLLLGVNQFWSVFASGAVIIVAVAIDYLIKRR